MLRNNCHTKLDWMDLNISMPGGSLINIGRLLSLNKLSKYVPTMSICLIMRGKRYLMARKMRSNLYLIVNKNVLLKSTLYTYKNPCATSHALYRVILPSRAYLTLKTYFDLIALQSMGSQS